jgi:hypothetical protein
MQLSPISVATTTTYRVEVSGWDNTQSFFVEKADLAWSESGEKLVALRRELREGTILFVRLLQPISPDRSHPIPYTAEPICASNSSQWAYRLRQVQPRTSRDEGAN